MATNDSGSHDRERLVQLSELAFSDHNTTDLYEVLHEGFNQYKQHNLVVAHRASSTVDRDIKNIMCKYDVPITICDGTYSAVKKLITTSCDNNISIDKKTYASIIDECI